MKWFFGWFAGTIVTLTAITALALVIAGDANVVNVSDVNVDTIDVRTHEISKAA